ncbi:MAG TPA: alanine--glyoxylate aminotransferase family protein [Dehalococcoidia bacterium]|jgi:aspartate aminotransferase-like enzyme
MSKQMINHRGPEFAEMQKRIMDRLKTFFRTANDVYVLTTSGTGAMETAVVNTLSAGDKVLVVSIGEFGERFQEICRVYGAEVTKVSFEPGTPADPQVVAHALSLDPSLSAVLITHNETSTGVTNDIQAVGKAIRAVRPDILYIVDAISSLGCVPFATDAWGVDVAVTASQKGFMIPPGLAFVAMSDRAWAAYDRCTTPKYYFDIKKSQAFSGRGQTPWTPAVSLYYALDLALDMMSKEGVESITSRHAVIGEYTRSEVKALGLKLLCEGPNVSNTVTSVVVPESVEAAALLALLNKEYETVLAGGQGKLAGKIVRIGHMGLVDKSDIKLAVVALGDALERLGYKRPAHATA